MKKAKSYHNFRNQNVLDRTVITIGTLYVRSKTVENVPCYSNFSHILAFYKHLLKPLLWVLYKRFIHISQRFQHYLFIFIPLYIFRVHNNWNPKRFLKPLRADLNCGKIRPSKKIYRLEIRHNLDITYSYWLPINRFYVFALFVFV